MNLVVRPAVEETVLRGLGQAARHNGDTLLGMLTDAQLLDAERHRRWACALVKMAQGQADNDKVIKGWIAKWEPLADKAIEALLRVTSRCAERSGRRHSRDAPVPKLDRPLILPDSG